MITNISLVSSFLSFCLQDSPFCNAISQFLHIHSCLATGWILFANFGQIDLQKGEIEVRILYLVILSKSLKLQMYKNLFLFIRDPQIPD